MIPGVLIPCLDCGEPTGNGQRCPEHDQARKAAQVRPRRTFRQRGYDGAWDRLSRRARRAQPFCSECGATENLTTHHTDEAWRRHDRGLPVRLQDVAVLCGPCNTRAGSTR